MFQLRIAFRYLKSKEGFSLGNTISIIGIFIGVLALIIVMSVMNGLEEDITRRILGLHSEIKIYNKDYSPIKNWEQLIEKINNYCNVNLSPISQAELMIMKNNNVSGTICQGIELEKYNNASNLSKNIYIGSPKSQDLVDGIILGSDLAVMLSVNFGDTITLVSPLAQKPTPFGLIPESKSLTVAGLFYTGIPEYDLKYTFTGLRTLQNFTDMGNTISFLEMKTKSPKKSLQLAKDLQENLLPNYLIMDWRKFEKHLFNAIKFEKKVMFLVLVLIFLVAGFNMLGNYLKILTQKKQDIGILKALGLTSKNIIKIFILNGIFIGTIGIISGLLVSLGLLFLQIKWHLLKIPISGMPFQSIPVKVEFWDIIIVIVVSFIITFLSTIIPVYKTTSIEPIKIIKESEE